MNLFRKTLTLFVLVLSSTMAFANDDVSGDRSQPSVVPVPVSKAYVPAGFDSNDRVRLMVEGYFPSTCYRVREPSVTRNGDSISVVQTAFKYDGPCIWMMVSYSQPVNVGLLKTNKYTVKDNDSGRTLAQLPVKAAVNAGPDDYMYANVKDAYVGYVDGNKREIVVSGVLPGDCWSLKEKRVFQDGANVVTVLPIIERKEKPQCNDYEMPFVTTIEIPKVAAGRYMLNVRSLNGESIIKLVDL